jgi:hypothetical protein
MFWIYFLMFMLKIVVFEIYISGGITFWFNLACFHANIILKNEKKSFKTSNALAHITKRFFNLKMCQIDQIQSTIKSKIKIKDSLTHYETT